ncbi:MAG: hypothetical protein KJO35_02650 [Gammaproteobacteria bacterium]|nr:hypothetical protein [Gammaproteobacteria bacterium]
MPEPVIQGSGSKLGIISLGSCDGAVREAVEKLGLKGVGLDYMRLKAFPFPAAVRQFVDEHEQIFVIEQNRDAQLRTLLINELEPDMARLVPLLHYNGLPITSHFIVNAIEENLAKGVAA